MPDLKPDLLTRMGGRVALADFVDGLYDFMAADQGLGAFLKKDAAAIPFDHYLKLLKERTVDFCAANFGDETYHGPDLFAAHAMLHISMDQYDVTMKCARKKLKKMKMPTSVQNEVYQEVENMRDPIVDPQGTFHKWLIEQNKQAEAAMDADEECVTNAMGFKVKGSTLKAWADKAAKDEERKKKMKEIRLQREAENKSSGPPHANHQEDKLAKDKGHKQAASAGKKVKRLTSADSTASAAPSSNALAPSRLASADSAPDAVASPKLKPPASLASASTAGSGGTSQLVSAESALTRSAESAAPTFHAPDEYRPGGVPRSRPTMLLWL